MPSEERDADDGATIPGGGLMFGRNGGMKTSAAETAVSVRKALMEAADAVVEYVGPLAKDDKLHRRIAAAIVAGSAARQRVRKQTGVTGLARRLASDPVLRSQIIELGTQLQAAEKRAKKARTHKRRNSVLLLSGVAIVIAGVPFAREKLTSGARARRHESEHGSWSGSSAASETTIHVGSDRGQGEPEPTQAT
jgi:hypothetical protein